MANPVAFVVEPHTLKMTVGKMKKLQFWTIMDDGSRVPATAWTFVCGTGAWGNVAPDGMYTAGTTPGDYDLLFESGTFKVLVKVKVDPVAPPLPPPTSPAPVSGNFWMKEQVPMWWIVVLPLVFLAGCFPGCVKDVWTGGSIAAVQAKLDAKTRECDFEKSQADAIKKKMDSLDAELSFSLKKARQLTDEKEDLEVKLRTAKSEHQSEKLVFENKLALFRLEFANQKADMKKREDALATEKIAIEKNRESNLEERKRLEEERGALLKLAVELSKKK